MTVPLKFFSSCPDRQICSKPSVSVLEPIGKIADLAKEIAPKLKEHYLTDTILRKWGRAKLAEYLKKKLPTQKRGKSGDLGEILATEYINAKHTPFSVPINRLRWKDSRELPMRGEDVIGFDFTTNPIRFLKTEAKSRAVLKAKTLEEARAALEKNGGLPLAHTLGFIMERLYELNEDSKAEMIEEYVTRKLPQLAQVLHLVFTFSGNDPGALLEASAKEARTAIPQYAVGLHVMEHQQLIASAFDSAAYGGES
jgi:hypothetical protein